MVAAYETSTRTSTTTPRDGRRSASSSACASGPSRGSVKNTYVALNGKHPVNHGFDGAARIIGGTHLIARRGRSTGTEQPFLYVPDFPDLPMEEVYPREAPRGAAVVAREHKGGGRTVYIPWNIGAIFWEVLAADHQRLIANAVRWALGKPPAVDVDGRRSRSRGAGERRTASRSSSTTSPIRWR